MKTASKRRAFTAGAQRARRKTGEGIGGRPERTQDSGLRTQASGLGPQDSGRLLLPYQAAFVDDPADIRVLAKSRRIGGTESVAFEVAFTRCFGRRMKDFWFSSADESAAREFMERVKHWARIFNTAVEVTTGEVVIDERKLKVYEAEFPGNVKCVAMASNPKAFRSKGGDVCLDEFAFHENAKEMWAAAWPVTTWGGRLTVLSTINSDQDMFWSLVEQGRRARKGESKPGDIPLSLHEVYLPDAVERGLVERINLVGGTSYTGEQFIARCRSGCDSQETFEREYLGRPSTEAGSFLPFDLSRPCVRPASDPDGAAMPSDSLVAFEGDLSRYSTGAEALYAGVDIGRLHDRFVVWVLARVGGMLRTAAVLVWQGRTFAEMDGAGRTLMEFEGVPSGKSVRRMCVDATGMGMMLGEEWEHAYRGRVEAIQITTNVKAAIYPLIRRHLEERTLTLPDCAVTLADLASVRKEVTVSGHVRYAGERTERGHADRACALALALHAAETPPSRVVGLEGFCQ